MQVGVVIKGQHKRFLSDETIWNLDYDSGYINLHM